MGCDSSCQGSKVAETLVIKGTRWVKSGCQGNQVEWDLVCQRNQIIVQTIFCSMHNDITTIVHSLH